MQLSAWMLNQDSFFLSFKMYLFLCECVFACMYVCMCATRMKCLKKPEEGTESLGTGVIESRELSRGCWNNPGLLDDDGAVSPAPSPHLS